MAQNPEVVDDVYVTVTTPEEFVAPDDAGLNVPHAAEGVPTPAKETTSLETGVPVELTTVAVSVDVEAPLAAIEVELAASATELLAVWVTTSGIADVMLSCDSTAVMVHVVVADAPAV